MKLSNIFRLPFLGNKEEQSLGIQLDKNFARVAVLEKEGKEFILPVMPFEVDLPEDTEQAGLVLRDQLDKREIKIKKAAVSIPIGSTLYKTLKLPKLSPQELEEAVEWNIREDIKSLKGSTIYDYDIIGEDENIYHILVVIAKIDEIEEAKEVLYYAGITPEIIDSEGIALINLANLQKEKDPALKDETNLCILHLDYNESYLIFFHNNIFVQTLNFDAKKYEEVAPVEKEKIVEKLIKEINYFFLTISEPKSIFTSGLFVRFPEIHAYMQLKFSTRFALVELDPVKALNIDYSGKVPLSLYSVPFGLAYRRFEDDKD